MTEKIKHYNKRLKALDSERSSFFTHWGELSDNILGYRGRFMVTDRNDGRKRNSKQLNNTARIASRVLVAGMMSGLTPRARPWFRLTTVNPDFREIKVVKIWLERVEKLLREIFSESNFYTTMSLMYGDLGTFGTAPMAIYEDFENVIRCQSFPIGQYFLGADGHGNVDTLYREYQLTVGQVVTQFGMENCTLSTQNNFTNGNTETWVDVIHVIEPNDKRDHMSDAGLPYRSVYYELGKGRQQKDKFLKESGFHEFPVISPRWGVAAEDVYATDCPGMTALGDVKALQVEEKMKAKGLDKMVDPPLQAPASMNGKRISQIPGDVSYVESINPQQKIQSIYDVRLDLASLRADIEAIEARVNTAYYKDLFLLFSDIANRERVTAEEIVRKHEEKLLMLSPALENLETELDKIIDRTFNMVARAGILPDPPPGIQGEGLKAEYIGVLAQAQKSVATTTIDRLITLVGTLAQVNPAVMDKIDLDQTIDEYNEALGAPAKIVRSDEEVVVLREQRAQQQRMQQLAAAAESAVPATQAAKNLADSDTSGKNVLTDIINTVSP